MEGMNLNKNENKKEYKPTKEEQRKVLSSLEYINTTKEAVEEKLKESNKDLQDKWNEKSYHEHKLSFMDKYYPKWEANEQTDYRDKLDEIKNVKIEASLKGDFQKQEQPGERFWYKSRKNEKKKIREYANGVEAEDRAFLHYGKNTVREIKALDKYAAYHNNYFDSRNNQRDLYDKYVNGKGDKQARRDEMDNGLRPFFSMTKKVLLWKKQIGLLGTETKEERDDGSEYNKRIMREYQENKNGGRTKVMNELAIKLIKFKLTPNMLTNKYLASNMLQMQRYTDMLNAFVCLTKNNPNYLDMKSDDHTDPEIAALISSRIIRMAPIMNGFMEKHAQFCGYKKDKKLTASGKIRKNLTNEEKDNGFDTDDKYNDYVKETWNAIKKAYDSTIDYMDDAADVKIGSTLLAYENMAKANREKQVQKSEFVFKYDINGSKAKEMEEIKAKIAGNPLVYDVFGSEIERVFERINEHTRRLDELSNRKEALAGLGDGQNIPDNKNIGIDDYKQIWKDYLTKENKRIDSEIDIIGKQLNNYKAAIDFFTGLNLRDKDLISKIDNALPGIKNVLKYEGFDHIFKLKDAFEYNDLFYKTLDYYDFDKYDEINDNDGKNVIKIGNMWSQYNYTLLKRGVMRTRYVNKLVNGVEQVDIKDPAMLNNINRRKAAQDNFRRYEAIYGKPKITIKDILAVKPGELQGKYALTGDFDVTREENYKTYFWIQKMVEICEDIELGNNIPEEYKNLSQNEKVDIRAKGRLFRDYFHKWKGVMEFTTSEAYDYIYDTPSIEGNNQVIDGIDKEYRLTRLTEMNSKIAVSMDKIVSQNPNGYKDDPKYKKLEELKKFISGMMEVNNYKAKEIKIFDGSAYEAYKAEILKSDTRAYLTDLYNKDYDDLIKDGLAYDDEKDRKKYLERIDTAIELQENCQFYVKNKESMIGKLGLLHNDNSLSAEEKKKYLLDYHDKFKIILGKIKNDYCTDGKLDDEKIIKNIRTIVADMDFVEDYVKYNHMAHEVYPEFLEMVHSSADLQKLGEQEMLLSDFRGYVWMLLYDHGISPGEGYAFRSRNSLKKKMVETDPESSKKIAKIKEEEKNYIENDQKRKEKLEQINERLGDVAKLRADEENAKKAPYAELKRRFYRGDKTVGMKVVGREVVFRPRTKFDSEYNALLEEKEELERAFDVHDEVNLLTYFQIGVYDEEIKKNQKDEQGKKKDWILLKKDARRAFVEKELEMQEMPVPRNYTDELFAYISRKAGDMEFPDHEKVKEILTAATKTFFFTLSKGARAEALLRLKAYEKDQSAMNDYFIWKNAKDTEKVLIERCRVFGQDKFVKNNIGTIKNIMDVIAESNASVNDMQTPRFLDELKEDLTCKGIDEKQFMFLLRKHTVGFAGKAVSKADANKSELNKKDVDNYLKVETKDDFLLKTSEDALKVGEAINLKDVNEDYIVEHFDECYFKANKLLAFQQLYYGERENFDRLYNAKGSRDLIKKVRTYFDKGHGESYALYYNAVISVANKFGITEKGGLSFGLTPVEMAILRDESKKDVHDTLKERAAKNMKDANKAVAYSLSTIKTAYEETELANKIDSAVSGSLVSVPLEERVKVGKQKKMVTKRDTYGLNPENKEQGAALEKFYNEYTDAYHGANMLYHTFKEQENSDLKVNYTVSSSFQPKMMFLLAPDENFSYASGKISATGTCNNFKNLLKDDFTNIGANLSVIDEDKCNSVIDMVKNLKLDMGKISQVTDANGKATSLYDEKFFDQKLKEDKAFYTNMVNAMNLCIIFEAKPEMLRIEDYKKTVNTAFDKNSHNMTKYVQWENVKKLESEYKKSKEDADKLDEKLRELQDQMESTEMEITRLKLASKDPKENMVTIEELYDKTSKIGDQINELTPQAEAAKEIRHTKFVLYDKAYEELYKDGKMEADKFNTDYLKTSKVDTLTAVRDMFSDNKTRFMVSTYFDLFSAYLLKKGIKIDGSLVNANIYDEVLEESTRSELGKENLERKDALDLGKMFSMDMKKYSDEIFKAKQDNIKSGEYLKEYKSLETVQKKITKDENGLVDVIKESFKTILDERHPKKKKKKENPVSDVDFVLKVLSDDQRFMLKKFGRVLSVKLSNEDTGNDYGLTEQQQKEVLKYSNITIWCDILAKMKTEKATDDTAGYGIVAAGLTKYEKKVLGEYNDEFKGLPGELNHAHNRLDALKWYVLTRDAAYLQSNIGKYLEDNKDELFSINS